MQRGLAAVCSYMMSAESEFITTVASGEKVVAMHIKMADKLEKTIGLPAIDPTSL